VDLQTRINLWFMHDGAPLHFLLASWENLNNLLPEQWIGQGVPRAWTSHSRFPDLNSLLCYLWALIKPIVCATEISDVSDSYDIWNFPASHAVTVQTCNILC
jgi:hypothetical protein